jgi:hypothetical protein
MEAEQAITRVWNKEIEGEKRKKKKRRYIGENTHIQLGGGHRHAYQFK